MKALKKEYGETVMENQETDKFMAGRDYKYIYKQKHDSFIKEYIPHLEHLLKWR